MDLVLAAAVKWGVDSSALKNARHLSPGMHPRHEMRVEVQAKTIQHLMQLNAFYDHKADQMNLGSRIVIPLGSVLLRSGVIISTSLDASSTYKILVCTEMLGIHRRTLNDSLYTHVQEVYLSRSIPGGVQRCILVIVCQKEWCLANLLWPRRKPTAAALDPYMVDEAVQCLAQVFTSKLESTIKNEASALTSGGYTSYNAWWEHTIVHYAKLQPKLGAMHIPTRVPHDITSISKKCPVSLETILAAYSSMKTELHKAEAKDAPKFLPTFADLRANQVAPNPCSMNAPLSHQVGMYFCSEGNGFWVVGQSLSEHEVWFCSLDDFPISVAETFAVIL